MITFSAKDWLFFFTEQLEQFPVLPFIWDSNKGLGLGGNVIETLWLRLYHFFSIYFLHNIFNLDYFWIELAIFFLPVILLSIFSSYYFSRSWIGSIIYSTNTYFLMIFGGGQMGVALAYSIVPLVFKKFIDLIEFQEKPNLTTKENLKRSLGLGLLLALEIMWDLRIAYITILGIFIYFLLVILKDFRFFKRVKKSVRNIFFTFFLPICFAFSLHLYWVFPLLKIRLSNDFNFQDLGLENIDIKAVQYLSIASLEQTISLLHPLWPENIFGKVGFMKWEFLLIPVLGLSFLLFTNKKNRQILSWSFIALLASFLAKGSSPPFGKIYLWLFENFPGMIMLRDSTKFYILIILSYSILIPFSLNVLKDKLRTFFKKRQFKFDKNFLLKPSFLFIIYWLFLIRPLWLGQLDGTFKLRKVPEDYIDLKNFLISEGDFFRTLWLPKKQRFGFYSYQHPVLSGQDWVEDGTCEEPFCSLRIEEYNRQYFNCHPNEHCYPADFSFLANPRTPELLSRLSIKYLVVPYDSEKEIFIADRKYDENVRNQLIKFVDSLEIYKKLDFPGQTKIYQIIPERKDHFWTESKGIVISYSRINPTKYKVEIKNAKQPFSLIFSERYDQFWQANISDKKISPEKFEGVLNSFEIDETGDFELTVEYQLQKFVNLGFRASALFIICAFFLFFSTTDDRQKTKLPLKNKKSRKG